MAARSLSTGSISFGLVSIPVRMFAATESKELHFHFGKAEGSPSPSARSREPRWST
jgi:non-homologous end joining protein Ku